MVGGGGGVCDVIFNITEGGLELFFFCFGGGVLSKFLLDNSSFSAPPPDNYCTVPYPCFKFHFPLFQTRYHTLYNSKTK